MGKGELCMCGAVDCPSCGPAQGYRLDMPSDDAIAEATDEIICDADLLAKHLEEESLAWPISEIMSRIDRACNGDQPSILAVLRGCHLLQKALRAEVEDAAYELAEGRMEA